jgi:hypothetical protein
MRNGEANFPPFLTPRNPRATCRVAPTFPRSSRCRCGGGHHTLHTPDIRFVRLRHRRGAKRCVALGPTVPRRTTGDQPGRPYNHRGRPSAERVGSGEFGHRGHASPPRDRWPRGEIVPRPTRARTKLFSRCVAVLCCAARHAPNLQTKRVLPSDKVAGCPQPRTRPTRMTRETCSAGAGGLCQTTKKEYTGSTQRFWLNGTLPAN